MERPLYVVAHSFVAPGMTHYAFAAARTGTKTRVLATGYGRGEEAALDALEHNVLAPPVPVAIKPPTKHSGGARLGHLAVPQPGDADAAFHSTCAIAGCGRKIVRVFGVQARRSNFRHLKATERI